MSINLAKGNAISTYSWADGVVKLRKPVSQGAEKRFLGAATDALKFPHMHGKMFKPKLRYVQISFIDSPWKV
jgi:hypothetical protein